MTERRPTAAGGCRASLGGRALRAQRTELQVKLKLGGSIYKLPFPRACDVLEGHVIAERKSWQRLTEGLAREHWWVGLVNYVCEVNSERYPPTYEEWLRPSSELLSARSAYRAGRPGTASRHLRSALESYNHVHRKWVLYRDGLQGGGERAIAVAELTITAVTITATAGWGAGLGLVKTAGMAAAFKGGTELSRAGGMVGQGVEETVDWEKLGWNVVEEFSMSLLTGGLAKGFLRVLGPRLSKTWKFDPDIARKLFSGGTATQQFFTNLATGTGLNLLKEAVKTAAKKAEGKDVSSQQFLDMVAEEYTRKLAGTEAGKQLISSVLEKVAKAAK